MNYKWITVQSCCLALCNSMKTFIADINLVILALLIGKELERFASSLEPSCTIKGLHEFMFKHKDGQMILVVDLLHIATNEPRSHLIMHLAENLMHVPFAFQFVLQIFTSK